MRTNVLRLFRVVAACVLVAGCGERDNLTSPAAAGPAASGNLLNLLAPTTVKVVTRNTPLSQPISASAVIGVLGGDLSVPGTGLNVIVPPLALTSSTRITVTAVAGSEVAYTFEPHGIHFLVPLVVTQDLHGTSAVVNGLIPHTITAGYFASLSDLNQANGTAVVSEVLNTVLSLVLRNCTFTVFHFSGYLIATD